MTSPRLTAYEIPLGAADEPRTPHDVPRLSADSDEVSGVITADVRPGGR